MSKKRKLDDLMEAITFAEAGETETARQLAEQVFPDETAAPPYERILAVGGASGFSPRMIDNALAMAERRRYGVVALTVGPALSGLAARLRGRRRDRAARSVEAFAARAAERKIPFVHTARSGEPEQAIADVRKRYRRIAFLVIEPDLTPRSRFSALEIPICYVVDA